MESKARGFDRSSNRPILQGSAQPEGIQAGRYRLKTELPAATALSMLLDPANIVRKKVTVIEGLRLTAQIKVLGSYPVAVP